MIFQEIPFDLAVDDVTAGNRKVQRRSYLSAGAFPIIDQGQGDIAGYTDDVADLYQGPLPAVLFGDHTRSLRYVNRPFALGADGVKVLAPKNGYDAKFLYYYFLSRKLPSHGYSRHLKFLREILIPVVPPSEQLRIVTLLDEGDRLRRLQRNADLKLEKIIPALFQVMFGSPENNHRCLRKAQLGALLKVKSGESLATREMVKTGTFPVYGGNGINGFHNRYMFEDQKIVIGRVGAYCGIVHYSEPNAWITDNALYVSEIFEPIDDRYLITALELANLNQYAGRAGQPLVSGSRIYPVEILVPPREDQQRFSQLASSILAAKLQCQASGVHIDRLWDVLLQWAFSGQLTAKWREDNLENVLAEMTKQARLLNLPAFDAQESTQEKHT